MVGRLASSERNFPYVFTSRIYAVRDHNFNPQSPDPLPKTIKGRTFFGTTKVFRREYVALCLLVALRVSFLRAAPTERG